MCTTNCANKGKTCPSAWKSRLSSIYYYYPPFFFQFKFRKWLLYSNVRFRFIFLFEISLGYSQLTTCRPPPPSSKVPKSGFWFKKLHNVLRRMKNRFLVFEIWFVQNSYGFFPNLPLPSVLIRFLWMMRNVLNRMKKITKKFSDFYFSSYREKLIENWDDDVIKWP